MLVLLRITERKMVVFTKTREIRSTNIGNWKIKHEKFHVGQCSKCLWSWQLYSNSQRTGTSISIKRGKDKLWNIHTMQYYSTKKLLITHYGSISGTLLSKTMFIFQ